jgi:hypothetical protein
MKKKMVITTTKNSKWIYTIVLEQLSHKSNCSFVFQNLWKIIYICAKILIKLEIKKSQLLGLNRKPYKIQI